MPIDRSNYPGIPADFPIEADDFSLAGAQPKRNLVEEDGKYFDAGSSPSEIAQAHELCEDLAQQFQGYCTRKLKEGVLTQDLILERAHQGLLLKQWCSPAQSLWTIRRAASLLGWNLPQSLSSIGKDE
jgi:hypothetical protein